MVHALQEARRVIKPNGLLIDIRPLARDATLELVMGERIEPIELIDGSLGKPHDAAVVRALGAIEEVLEKIDQNYFQTSVNYHSLEEMITRLSGSERQKMISDKGVSKIRNLAGDGPVHVRYFEQVQLTTYRLR